MRRFLSFVFIIGFFAVTSHVYSQEPSEETVKVTFDQAYAEYTASIEEYNKAHAEYVLKRAQYLRFQSLKSRQDAYDATLLMLKMRDGVVISYLNAVKARVDEGMGIPDDKKNILFLKIDGEIEWFTNHRDNLSTTGSLEDLVGDSKLAAARWSAIDPLAYEAMSLLAQGKITGFSERMDEIFSTTENKLERIRSDDREGYSLSSTKIETLNRWIFEADGRISRSKEKQKEADLLISQMPKDRRRLVSNYDLIISRLRESQSYMKEATRFIKEIIKQVKIEE
jgi:hypothetical protein